MLQFGSRGQPVARLQGALNLDRRRDRILAVDGDFGIQTLGRVRHFQSVNGTVADGIVGPVTMGLLSALFALLDKAGGGTGPGGGTGAVPPPPPPPPPLEAGRRQMVVQSAMAAATIMGWSSETSPPPEGSLAIATRFLAKEGGGRGRQGAGHLAAIFTAAGLPTASTVNVGQGCARFRNGNEECSADAYKAKRNQSDIVSWCGIFALSVVRTVGIPVGGWLNGNVAANKGFRLISPAEVQPGDIGINEPVGRNHHFIVIDRKGDQLWSVDGNAGAFLSILGRTYRMLAPDSTRRDVSNVINHRGEMMPTAFFTCF